MKILKLVRHSSGQALVETALILPLLMLVLLNAVNFGYYYLVALNLTSASRTGSLYGMIGSATPAGTALPPATGTASTTVSYLTYQDMYGSMITPFGATVQVCSAAIGLTGTGALRTALCETCTSSSSNSGSCTTTGATGSPAPDVDPEAPTFVLNRVDVTYTFSPIIPGTPFGLFLLTLCPSNQCTFSRHLSMRAMGS